MNKFTATVNCIHTQPIHDPLCNVVLNTISEGVILLNGKLEITYQNTAAEIISGYKREDVEGLSALQLVHPEHIDEVIEFIQSAVANPGKQQYTQIRILHKDDSYIWIEGSLTDLTTDPQIASFVVNYRDITAQKESEDKLKDMYIRLEKMVKERTAALEAFNYSVSHDLRAPIRAINGLSNMILQSSKEVLDSSSLRMLNDIISESNHMNCLTDDLMRLAQSGVQPLTIKETDMKQLVKNAVHQLQLEMNNNVDIIIADLPTVACDPGLLFQVWSNLISNAVKYSSKCSQSKIEIGCINTSENPVFYIKDNGAGFNMKYASKLFTAFNRLHARSQFEGTGVGLSLVKRIIDKHNGKVWAEAEENKGATFRFTLKPCTHDDFTIPHAPEFSETNSNHYTQQSSN